MKEGIAEIYVLKDPRNNNGSNEIRYVGKTEKGIAKRLAQHLKNSKQGIKCHVYNWIKNLENDGLIPIIEVVDEVPIEEWGFWETYWIQQLRAWGCNLCNQQEGGSGGVTKEISKKISEKHKENYRNGYRPTKRIGYSVIMCDLEGNELKTFESCTDAAKYIGKYENGGDGAISSVARGGGKIAYGYKWKLNKEQKIKILLKQRPPRETPEHKAERLKKWSETLKQMFKDGKIKRGNAMKGKKHTEESLKIMSDKVLNWYNSERSKEYRDKHHIKVKSINKNTGEEIIHKSANSAAKHFEVDRATIRNKMDKKYGIKGNSTKLKHYEFQYAN